MLLMLDEDVPRQTLEVLKHLLRTHEVTHVQDKGWKGKSDVHLFRDAAAAGYHAILTNNHKQLNIPHEVAALKKARLHHICYGQKIDGLQGLALSIGAVVASMPAIMADLDSADGQRLVEIKDLDPRRRYVIQDPRRDPPKYWPR